MALEPNTDKHNSSQPHTVAIASGSRGAGTTSVALNLGLTLARQGRRVLLLDGDAGGREDLSSLLGFEPERDLGGVLEGRYGLDEALLKTDYDLAVLPGANALHQCLELERRDTVVGVLEALARLEKGYDYLLLDAGSDLDVPGLHMVASAALACLVVTPDPESMKQGFSLIRRLRKKGYRRVPSVVVNMAAGASQAQSVFQRLDGVVGRHLGDSLHYLGAVWRDETLRHSVVTRVPVALLPVSDPSCRQFHTLADMLDVRLSRLPAGRSGVAGYWQSLIRRRHRVGNGNQGETVESPRSAQERLSAAMEDLDAVLGSQPDMMLRYEAFNRLFALLGRSLDADAIEFIQTGLAAMPWEQIAADDRQHMARHLRHLADHLVAPAGDDAEVASVPANSARPLFDRISPGEQQRLVQALREQPTDISIDQLFRDLASRRKDPS